MQSFGTRAPLVVHAASWGDFDLFPISHHCRPFVFFSRLPDLNLDDHIRTDHESHAQNMPPLPRGIPRDTIQYTMPQLANLTYLIYPTRYLEQDRENS